MDPGTAIRCEMTKWGDRRHWHFDGLYLGSDEHGEWLGFPRGTHNHRPGYEFHSQVDAVTLVPREGWYAATFHAPGIWCDIYVDMTTPGEWDGTVLRAVDLDLDVIRMSPEPDAPPAPVGRSAGPGDATGEAHPAGADARLTARMPWLRTGPRQLALHVDQ